jgi:hypothetical protein
MTDLPSTPDALAHALCSALETPPEMTVKGARAEYREWKFWHNAYHDSPRRWWTGIITSFDGRLDEDSLVIWHPVPGLTNDIAVAWRVVEEMRERGWLLNFNGCYNGWIITGHRYELSADGDWGKSRMTSDIVQEAGDSAPEAICRAALAALTAK